jgi:hypothetical protein
MLNKLYPVLSKDFIALRMKGMDSCVINYVYSPIISRLSTKEISCEIKKVFYSDF